MTDVESSNLKSVYYNTFFNSLEVEFKSGSKYQYLNVPYEVYRDLLAVESKGQYFDRNIKKRFTTIQVAPGLKAVKRNVKSAISTVTHTFLPESLFTPPPKPPSKKRVGTVTKIKSVKSIKTKKN